MCWNSLCNIQLVIKSTVFCKKTNCYTVRSELKEAHLLKIGALPNTYSPDLQLCKGVCHMKKHQQPFVTAQDTPATRKRRLQQRLQEISDKSEQELVLLMKSIDKVKTAFRTEK
jgi:hypothetical protein